MVSLRDGNSGKTDGKGKEVRAVARIGLMEGEVEVVLNIKGYTVRSLCVYITRGVTTSPKGPPQLSTLESEYSLHTLLQQYVHTNRRPIDRSS